MSKIRDHATPTPNISGFFLPQEFNEMQSAILGGWIMEMLQTDPHRRPNVRALCNRFTELLNLLGPLSSNGRVEPKEERIFFSAEDLLGTEMQIWPSSPQYAEIFPGRCTHQQQSLLGLRRRMILNLRTKLFGKTSPNVVWFKVYLGWTFFYTEKTEKARTQFSQSSGGSASAIPRCSSETNECACA
jgi:hypothetical protein